MPHLPPLRNDEAEADARAALEHLEARLGRVPNMYRTFAHAPRILSAAISMAQAIRADLDPKLRELAYLKVTQITNCAVCRHYHIALGRKAGVTEEQINDLAVFESSSAFTDIERDVLRFTDQWSRVSTVAADVMARLRRALSPEHLVILAATVAQANFTSRFNNTFGVELP